MKEETSAPVQHCIGQVRALFYLLDEPTTILTLQTNNQMIMAHASGQAAQDLRALPRGATICVTLHDVLSSYLEIVAFAVIPARREE